MTARIWLRRGLLVLLTLLALLALAAATYVWRSFPVRDGALQLAGLQKPVRIERDGADVTHIRAQSADDAWMALGYVHAQERGWQLEFNRRLMHGRLSEILGDATLETDKLLRTLGIARAADRQYANLPAEARSALQAYSNGINAFFTQSSQALPPEFLLLGTQPGGGGPVWTPQDSVGWALMMALDLGGNWGNEFARLSAAKVLDTQRLWQLFPPYPGEKPATSADLSALYRSLGVYRTDAADATKSLAVGAYPMPAAGIFDSDSAQNLRDWATDWNQSAGTVEGKGSNNWVVAGSHSTSGKPLLANDPHLGLSAPAIWYFARLQAPASRAPDGSSVPALDVIGATLPGLPFVVLGRTSKVAWGFTNTGPDVQDLYLEQINPANPQQYRLPDVDGQRAWGTFSQRLETIQIKGQPDLVLPVRESRHGPVLSDAQSSHGELLDLKKYVLALRWSALDSDNRTVLAGMRSNTAQSVEQLIAANADYHSPMQSMVAADTTGKVAFKTIGKLPLRRPNDLMGMAPAPGWDAHYDWAGWISYADTPQDDPAQTQKQGWIATANQRITPPGYGYFIGQDWTVPYRFDRISEVLAARPQHDMASLQALQRDQFSPATAKLLPYLQKAESKHPLAAAARQQLTQFDGVMRAESAAALVFAAWADELTRGLLIPRIGEARFKALYGKRNFRSTVEDILATSDAWWCAPLNCAQHSSAALDRALERLQKLYGSDVAGWQWGRAHFASSVHRPFGGVPTLAHFFDVRVESGGDNFSVDVGQYWANDIKTPFANRHAASLRAVYDLANLENSVFIYQTGQSGLVFSPRYRDMAQSWASGQYRLLQMQPTEITHRLVLTP